MNLSLTAEQLQEIDKGEAVSIFVGGRECVLLQSDSYSQMRNQIDQWNPLIMQFGMAQLMNEDWGDPAMSVYDEL